MEAARKFGYGVLRWISVVSFSKIISLEDREALYHFKICWETDLRTTYVLGIPQRLSPELRGVFRWVFVIFLETADLLDQKAYEDF